MTTPAMSYYEQIIKRDPSIQRRYKKHLWPALRSSRSIRSFTYKYGADIYEYSAGLLTVRKSEPHPDWHAPAEYLKPVKIRLSPRQEQSIRNALEATDFPNMRTDPCSMVNLAGDYMISEHLSCRFRLGGEYQFASQSPSGKLEALESALKAIAGSSGEYRKIEEMGKWIFDFKRLERLKKQGNRE